MTELECSNCQTVSAKGKKFCRHCGKALVLNIETVKTNSLNRIIWFYIAFLLFAIISNFIYGEYPFDLGIDLGIETAFAAMVVIFSALNWHRLVELYKLPQLNLSIIFFTLIFPFISGFGVYYLLEYASNNFLYLENENIYESFFYLDNPIFWSVIFVAVVPAIFEEMAFRGYLFTELFKVTSARVTIIATAFIFALIHFSFISLIWIFPFGLVLGYLRYKYNTLWYGMIIHFTHNLIVLLLDYYYSYENIESFNFLQ